MDVKEGIERMTELMSEITQIGQWRENPDMDNERIHELITRVMCQMNRVETHGSGSLEHIRNTAIRMAEGVVRKTDEGRKGGDP